MVTTRRAAAAQEGAVPANVETEEKPRKASPGKNRQSRKSSSLPIGEPAAVTSSETGALGLAASSPPPKDGVENPAVTPARRRRPLTAGVRSPGTTLASPGQSPPAHKKAAPSDASPKDKLPKSPPGGNKATKRDQVANALTSPSPKDATPKKTALQSPAAKSLAVKSPAATKARTPGRVANGTATAATPKSAAKSKDKPAVEDASEQSATTGPVPGPPARGNRGRPLLWAVLVLLVAVALGAGVTQWYREGDLTFRDWKVELRLPSCCAGSKAAAPQTGSMGDPSCALSFEADKVKALLARTTENEEWVDNFVEEIHKRASSESSGVAAPSAAAVMVLAGATPGDSAKAAQALASAFPSCEAAGCLLMLRGSELTSEYKKLLAGIRDEAPAGPEQGMNATEQKRLQRDKAVEELKPAVVKRLSAFLSQCPRGVVVVEGLQGFPRSVASVLHNLMSEQGDYAGASATSATVLVTVEMQNLESIAALSDIAEKENALKKRLLKILEKDHKPEDKPEALTRRFKFVNVLAHTS